MSVLAKADFFHTREYIHIQLANSNIVKTLIFLEKNLAEVESEVEVKYWIAGTTGETGFHSILFARFIRAGTPAEFPLVPCYKSPHRHSERDPDRCPVRISAGTCENTGVHSRGK